MSLKNEGKTFGSMLELRTPMSGAGNLAINILNEPERLQVLESNVMEKQQHKNKELEVYNKIKKLEDW